MYNRRWGKDRRRFLRLNLNLVVWYRIQYTGQAYRALGTAEREAVTLDISPFGMAFMSSYPLAAFTDLSLRFIIFSSENGTYNTLTIPIEVSARVRSCSPSEKNEYRIGVSFTNIELEKQQKLAQFMVESQRAFI
jgi:c-di-GMP-binding flagellar brake protein YcgR